MIRPSSAEEPPSLGETQHPLIALFSHALKLWSKPLEGFISVHALSASTVRAVSSVVLPCAVFMWVGPALMMVNKHIMQNLEFAYPLSLSGLGLLTSAVVVRLLVRLGLLGVRPESMELVRGAAWYRTALPIGLAKAATLACGNAAYLYLGLGFIQMLKALTPAVVVLVLRLNGMPLPPRVSLGFVVVIIAGTLLEVRGEMGASFLGIFLMFASEFMEAVNLVLTQSLLQNSNFTVVEGLYTLALPGTVALFSLAAVAEWPRMMDKGQYLIMLEHPSWFASAAALGFMVNFVGLMVVRATSSLTTKILGIVRTVGLVVVGCTFYGELCSMQKVVGYSIALAGFAGYQWGQMDPKAGELCASFFGCPSTRLCGSTSAGRRPSLASKDASSGAAAKIRHIAVGPAETTECEP